jgi:hypothetical protein
VAELVFTTNQPAVVLTGVVAVNTAAVQVSINDGAYVTDPTLGVLNLQSFTLPSPVAYPGGLPLTDGINTIRVRVIDILGAVSAPATATLTRVRSLDGGLGVEIPSGIRLRRRRGAVDLLTAKPQVLRDVLGTPMQVAVFRGFNLYASSTPAGQTGYYKINAALVTTSSTVFEEDVIGQIPEEVSWGDGKNKNLRLVVTEEDEFGTELTRRLDTVVDVSQFFERVRFSASIDNYQIREFVPFRHIRGGGPNIINEDQFGTVDDSSPLYYVVTGVYYDPTLGQEVETPYSQEVVGQPLVLDTTIRDLPGRTFLQIVIDYITAVQRVNQTVALIPGSTTRDTLDPFASEAERLWFLMDFVHRSQSFLTLLAVDDANGDGVSDPVVSSAYKTALRAALGYTSDQATQSLIDQQFDKLAGNVQHPRLPGRAAVGQVVVYTPTKPTKDIVVPAGSFVTADADPANGQGSVRFRIGGSYVLPAAQAEAFYNYDTKRYEIIADVVCETIGETGNRPADSIHGISGVSGVFVTNTEATIFGTNIETNAELAARSILAFTSVDTGTEGGYASTVAAQAGILKAKIVKSGDPLMMRDYDDVRGKHIGGKVDIFVQGLRERQVTEVFAFAFEIARDIPCQVVDLGTLTFRVLDSRVTAETPLLEILNNPGQGLGVRNASKGLDYDLTNVQILDYQTFRLDASIPQPVTALDDVVLADYRFRSVDKFYPTLQPVRRVVSVVGEVSGPLAAGGNYKLYKTDDPLITGESTIARYYVSIVQSGGNPSGNQIQVNHEAHVLIGFIQEPLDSVGINSKTIRVFNADRSIEFNGPEDASPDFDIVAGTPTTPIKIVRTAPSAIASGQAVSVDYTKDENFTLTYVINDLLQEVQQVIEKQRHVTADVLVKQAINNPIDIETTIQLLSGATKDRTDPLVRSNVSIELNEKLIGQGIAQSDVINAVDSTSGVDYEIVPLARMAYADGGRRIREMVLSTSVHVSSLDIGGQRAFLLSNPLTSPTTDGGGLDTEHKGVFQDDVALTLSPTLAAVAQAPRQAFIIGSGGAVIVGYSDDATLTALGFATAADRQAERLRRTANHVVVSLVATSIPPDEPGLHVYTVSYVVRGDKGPRDIAAADVEYVELGSLVITYRSASLGP